VFADFVKEAGRVRFDRWTGASVENLEQSMGYGMAMKAVRRGIRSVTVAVISGFGLDQRLKKD
jgi:hypothetical protein